MEGRNSLKAIGGTIAGLPIEWGAFRLMDNHPIYAVMLAVAGLVILGLGWWPELKDKRWTKPLFAILILAVAIGVIWHRLDTSPPPKVAVPNPNPSLTGNNGRPDNRVFVAFGPQYLIEMVRGRSPDEIEKLEELYRNRWMKVHGVVALVPYRDPLSDDKSISVMIDYLTTPGLHESDVFCKTRGDDAETALTFQKLEDISVVGRIRFINGMAVALDPCEIVSFGNDKVP